MPELSTLGATLRDAVGPLDAWKPPARVVAETNLTLSGEQTMDGVACVAGDLVLAAGQSTATARGPYVVAAGAWQRASWFAIGVDARGACLKILAGTHAGEEWQQTASPAIVGTNSLTWAQSAGGGGGGTGTTWYSFNGDTISDLVGIDGDMAVVATGAGIGNVLQKTTGHWLATGNIRGAAGTTGSAGATGAAGSAGATGATGSAGAAGAAGSNGTNGLNVLNGTGVPGGGTGVNGEFYLRTDTSQMYGPKAGGAWPAPVALIGATGSTGATGSAGSAGATGAAGPSNIIRTTTGGGTDLTVGAVADGEYLKRSGTGVISGTPSAGSAWGGSVGDTPIWVPPSLKGETPDAADDEFDSNSATVIAAWEFWDGTGGVARTPSGAVDPFTSITGASAVPKLTVNSSTRKSWLQVQVTSTGPTTYFMSKGVTLPTTCFVYTRGGTLGDVNGTCLFAVVIGNTNGGHFGTSDPYVRVGLRQLSTGDFLLFVGDEGGVVGTTYNTTYKPGVVPSYFGLYKSGTTYTPVVFDENGHYYFFPTITKTGCNRIGFTFVNNSGAAVHRADFIRVDATWRF